MKNLLIRSTVIAAAAMVLQFGFVPASFAEARQEQGSSNGQPFRTLQDEIDLLSLDLADAVAHLQRQIDELVESQADQDEVIAALQGALAELGARVTENEADIAALEAWNAMQDQLIAGPGCQIDGPGGARLGERGRHCGPHPGRPGYAADDRRHQG